MTILKSFLITGFAVFMVGCQDVTENEEETSEPEENEIEEEGVPEGKTPITVLMYHHFDDDEEAASSVTVPTERFEDQLEALQEEGYETITEEKLAAFYNGEDVDMPEKPLVITIDDGYESNYEIAYPLLDEMEMHATIYVVTSYRGETPGSNPHFGWDEAAEMAESEYIDIQNHSHDLHHYVETEDGEGAPLINQKVVDGELESEEEYMERIIEDFETSEELIEEHVGNEVFTYTYPFGAFNEDVVEIGKERGYELMYTVREGINTEDTSPYELQRINADGDFSGEDLIEQIESYH
ncbi:polysaccharide deacetylase family protein [Salsuginibacillus kocurii]|uniref:polysaccharide deacetylase family protein n=1 Tax=Salsuginibacillus kocurii TaxID=427078 RepID=UPI00037AC645|nr:polysaccharide deacetylase family protein [Salsuginibacillus kocurii]